MGLVAARESGRMRFNLGENLPIGSVGLLHPAGHNASSVFEQSLAGGSDERLINVCRQEARALPPLDLDFTDIGRNRPLSMQAWLC